MLMLFKFDLKNTWFKMFIYCLIVAVFTAATIYFWSESFEGFFNDENFYWINIFKFASIGVSGAVFFICLIMTFIALAQWFAQNLMADEGHFMNMLPVSRIKLYSSKVLTAVLWNVVLIGFMVLCVFVFLKFGGKLEQLDDIVADLLGDDAANVNLGKLLTYFGIFVTLHSIVVTLLAYVSICIGHLVDIGKNFITLLGFIGLGLAEMIIGIALAYALGVFNFGNLKSLVGIMMYFNSFFIKMSVTSVVSAIINFALGVYLLDTRLNID